MTNRLCLTVGRPCFYASSCWSPFLNTYDTHMSATAPLPDPADGVRFQKLISVWHKAVDEFYAAATGEEVVGRCFPQLSRTHGELLQGLLHGAMASVRSNSMVSQLPECVRGSGVSRRSERGRARSKILFTLVVPGLLARLSARAPACVQVCVA